MLTKWGRIASQFVVNPTSYPLPTFSSAPSGVGAIVPVKSATDGDSCFARVVPINISFDPLVTTWLANTSRGFAFGTGDAAATENDYDLESRITSGINVVKSDGSVYDAKNNTVEYYLQYTITNTGSEDITIKEIGIFQTVYTDTTSGGTSTSRQRPILTDRTVLETPLTIAAGEPGILRWSMKCDTV